MKKARSQKQIEADALRTGRPRVEDPRCVLLTIRLTKAEAEKLRTAAENTGMGLIPYARMRMLEGLR